MTTRKKHSKEFVLDAILLVNEQGDSKGEAVKNLRVSLGSLDKWIR